MVPVTEQMILGPRNGTNGFMGPAMGRKIWKWKKHAKIEIDIYAQHTTNDLVLQSMLVLISSSYMFYLFSSKLWFLFL